MQTSPAIYGQNAAEGEKLTRWANEPTVLALKDDLKIAEPWQQTHVKKVRGWLDQRNIEGSAKIKEVRGRSKIQPKLVRRQAEWRYPALSEPFLSSDKTFKVSPRTWEDVKSANQNELLLNWQFRSLMNSVRFIDDFVRTTVDEGTCFVKVGWLRKTRKKKIQVPLWQYVAVTYQDEMDALQKAAELKSTNPQGFEELPEEIRESVNYWQETGTPALANQIGTTEIEQEVVVKNQPTLEILHYENVFIDPAAEGDITKANFAIVSFETSKAELLKDGRYKNLDKVNWSSNQPLNVPHHASRIDPGVAFRDDLRKRVVAYEYWGFYDVDGSDELKPIVATWIGNTMIRMEENPFPDQEIPIVAVSYLPVKNSLTGEPDAELLSDNQAVLGAVTRGMIDIMGKSANGQMAFAKGALDVLNRRKFEEGRDYEFNPGMDPRNMIYQHVYPEIPNSALTMLTLQNQEAEALTGVKAFSGGLSGEGYGKVAAGIRGLMDAAAKREMSILRRLAQGMSEIGRKIVAMNAVFLTDEEVVQVTNEEFVKVRREDLVGQFNTVVDIATAEVDEAQAQDLGFMLQTIGNSLPLEMTQKVLAQIAKLKRMPELAHDIMSFQPKPDPLAAKKMELEIARMDAEIAEIKSKAMLNQAKAQAEVAKTDKTNLDFVEQETGTTHARDMALQQSQAEANQMLEITKRVLQPAEGGNKRQEVADALQLHGLARMSS